MRVKSIASLEPGKTYVLGGANFRTKEDAEKFKAQLEGWAPGCKFLLLPAGVTLLTSSSVELASVEDVLRDIVEESAKESLMQ